MKIFLVILVVLQISSGVLLGQTQGSISISVVVPTQQITMDKNTFSILKSRIESIMASNGVSSASYGGIVMYPVVNVVGQEMVETGMKNMHVIDLELNLYIKQIITETTFGSTSIICRGSGYSLDEAKRNAMTKIKATDTRIKSFIHTAKEKIYQYYGTNTDAIITKAESMAHMEDFEGAIALLSTYPETLPDYGKIANVMMTVYDKYLSKYCEQTLMQATNAFNLKKYDIAADYLSHINMQSSCAEDAKKLSSSIKEQIELQEALTMKLYNEEIARQEEHRRNDIELKKYYMDTMKEIASYYYSQNTNYSIYVQ